MILMHDDATLWETQSHFNTVKSCLLNLLKRPIYFLNISVAVPVVIIGTHLFHQTKIDDCLFRCHNFVLQPH